MEKVISIEKWKLEFNNRTEVMETNFHSLYISVHPYLILKEKHVMEFSGYHALGEEIIKETEKIHEVLYMFEDWLDQIERTNKPTAKMYKKIMSSKPGTNCDTLFAEMNNIYDALIEKKEEMEKKLLILNKEID
ncbi:MAG: hypothetical protein ABI855_06045 [Bacteroidota bacterium]